MTKRIGARIQSRRKELKMGADELAQKIGKSKATLYRYENGDIENVPLDILTPIAEALEVSPAYLMGWEQVQKNNSTITDAVLKMRSDNLFLSVVEKLRTDEEFLSIVVSLAELDREKLSSLRTLLK